MYAARACISLCWRENRVRAFLLPIFLGNPEFGLVLAHVGQHGAAQEDKVLAAGWILDVQFEFLRNTKHEITRCGKGR